jgi:transposase-like protein
LMLIAAPWFLAAIGFMSGLVKCPRCDRRFMTTRIPYVPRRCGSCGFDITTVGFGTTSNYRLERP